MAVNFQFATAQRQQPLLAQRPDCPVDMNGRQAKRIRDMLLPQWPRMGTPFDQFPVRTPMQYGQNEMRYPLPRRAPADTGHSVMN